MTADNVVAIEPEARLAATARIAAAAAPVLCSVAGPEIPVARHEWTVPKWVPLPVAEFALGRAVKPRS